MEGENPYSYAVEHARSGRAACKFTKCKGKIAKDELRINRSAVVEAFGDHAISEWHHVDCFFLRQLNARNKENILKTTDDLEGFNALPSGEQALIQKYLSLFQKKKEIPLLTHSDGNTADLAPKKRAPKGGKRAGGGADAEGEGEGEDEAVKEKPKKKPRKKRAKDADDE